MISIFPNTEELTDKQTLIPNEIITTSNNNSIFPNNNNSNQNSIFPTNNSNQNSIFPSNSITTENEFNSIFTELKNEDNNNIGANNNIDENIINYDTINSVDPKIIEEVNNDIIQFGKEVIPLNKNENENIMENEIKIQQQDEKLPTFRELLYKYGDLKLKDFIPAVQYYYPHIEAEEIIDIYKNQIGKEVIDPNKPLLRKHQYVTLKIPGSYQMDIVYFVGSIPYLMFIEVVSRKIWLYYIMNKSQKTFMFAFTIWYHKNQTQDRSIKRIVKCILMDQERAFMSNEFDELCAHEGIRKLFKDKNEHNVLKILDQAVYKIKKLVYKRCVEENLVPPNRLNIGKYGREILKVEDEGFVQRLNVIIMDVLDNYNNIPQPNIDNYTPNEVNLNPIIQNELLKKSIEHNDIARQYQGRYNVGDMVRVKERNDNPLNKMRVWSDECYVIDAVLPYSYKLRSIYNKYDDISKYAFKHYELKKINSNRPTNFRSLVKGPNGFKEYKEIEKYEYKYPLLHEPYIWDDNEANEIKERLK